MMKKIKEYKPHNHSGRLLNANEMSEGLDDSIIKELQDQLMDIDFNRYPDNECTLLRKRYANVLQIEKDNILAGNGSDQILGLLIGYFLKRGKCLLTLDPDFGMYDYYCGTYEAKIIKYKTKEDGSFDVYDFIQYAKMHNVDMILFSNPNNPTGFLLSNEYLEILLKNMSIPVVVDEAYAEFAKNSAIPLIKDHPNLYITRTLSKAYALAGARVGFLISQKKNIDKLQKANVPYVLNSISQMIAITVLKHAKEFGKRVDQIIENRERLVHMCFKHIHVFSSQGNFVKVQADNLKRLLELFENNNVIIRTYPNKDFIRVTIGNKEDLEAVIKIFEQYEKKEEDHAKS